MEWIPVAALIVSLSTLLAGYFALRQKAGESYVKGLENRIVQLERDLKQAESDLLNEKRAHKNCQEERIHLMERLLRRQDNERRHRQPPGTDEQEAFEG